MKQQPNVLVAGVAGASLGTEIVKSLQLAGRYRVFCCDISELAFGHYMEGVHKTFRISRDRYADDLVALCRRESIDALVPGGEEPALLIGQAQDRFREIGVKVASNSRDVVETCSDKAALFSFLGEQGVPIPLTMNPSSPDEAAGFKTPCVVKPATGTGGSSYVFLAATEAEARLYVRYLLDNGQKPVLQEYVDEKEGEMTIGVLHLPDGSLAGSIALRRSFNAKISVMSRTPAGIISSGYSQGLIDEFPEIRRQAEAIAGLCGSRGPLNIQGRVRDGVLLPFEINPRFSATTYLRALAGFNEVDMFLQSTLAGRCPEPPDVNYGWYLRTLAETYVPKDRLVE